MERVGGIIQLQVDGEVYRAKGSFSWNLGEPLREAVEGADGTHGYKETPQTGFIEGEITDTSGIKLTPIVRAVGVSVSLELPNGKLINCSPAVYAGEGTGNTDEGAFPVRWIGKTREISA